MLAVAEGLASTGRPFLWVVRDNSRWLLHEDALVACGDKGRVVAWCLQGHVLGHGAVGCFVTHCGWNSVAEALAAGVPMVGYPW
jgi:UDP:flavonoid glycosyltransferase YjiC (YdhE family)